MIGMILTFFMTIFTATNPIGGVAIFTGLTSDLDESEKRATATKTGFASFIIMLVVLWIGSDLLLFFGITIPGLESAGGLIILLMGLSMLHSKTSTMKHHPDEHEDALEKESIAVVPLAMPILAGPGTIATIIVFTTEHNTFIHKLVLSGVCALIAVVIWGCLYFSTPISKYLGKTGINITTRIMGMVLAAMAFQMLASGLKKLLPGLG